MLLVRVRMCVCVCAPRDSLSVTLLVNNPVAYRSTGLDNAGKTTTLCKHPPESQIPRDTSLAPALVREAHPHSLSVAHSCADKLHLGEVVVTQPTIGSNVESITHKNLSFEAWDLGGQVCENRHVAGPSMLIAPVGGGVPYVLVRVYICVCLHRE